MGEHALCGAHWQKRRPPHEIEQWRQSTVCRKVSSVHEERASGKQPGLPPRRARCCSRLPEARKLRAARQNEVGSQFSVASPQTTWYLWPEETSCRGVAGEFNHYRLDRLGKLGPDASKWVCNSRALAAQQPRCLVYAFGGHAEFDGTLP